MPASRRMTIQTDGLVDQDRLRQVVEVLRESPTPGPTRVRIARELGGVSLRTVDRALVLLEAQGARIDRIRAGSPKIIHFQLTKGPVWDEHVTSEARLALRLAGLSLSQCGTQLWQEKLGVIEALASKRMSHRDRRLFEQLQRCVRVQGGVEDPIEASEVLEPILQALENGREIEVEYQAAGAKAIGVRKVVPYALTHDLYSGAAFLLVWDDHHKKPIHLRLNRIAKVISVGRMGAIPDLELMERAAKYQIGGWTSEQEPFEVEVRIEGAHWVQALKEAPPALPEFSAIASRNGQSMTVKFMANHENGPTRWILQFGAAAEVIRPISLRDHVASQHAEAMVQYIGR